MDSAPPAWKVLYQDYLDLECTKTLVSRQVNGLSPLSVGIVGAGMAGLYSALLLQKQVQGVRIKILEADDRVGGRIYTHKFSSEPYQYCDAGATRIPDIESHKPVFTLIDHLNQIFPSDPIKVVEYHHSCPEGNRMLFNNTKQKDGRLMSVQYASQHPSELGFPMAEDTEAVDGATAAKLLSDALLPVAEALKSDFSAALKKYSPLSLHDYLSKDLGWSQPKIQYVEAVTGHSNEFRRGLLFELLQTLKIEKVSSWKTIEGGMSTLPERCAKVLCMNKAEVLLNSKVEAIEQLEDGSVRIGYRIKDKPNSLAYESFDAVILAIPPPQIRMIPQRPNWDSDLERTLRSTYIIGSTKAILQFKTRFWEYHSQLHLPPSLGGSSKTDLPIRELVYPSHGIGDRGKGVLCVYAKGHDAAVLTFLSKKERVKLALQNLQALYPEVDVTDEYVGDANCENDENAFIQDWPITCVCYFPGDFLSFYPTLIAPQGSIFFAGSHLSQNSLWIVGALESSKQAVQQLVLQHSGTDFVTYI